MRIGRLDLSLDRYGPYHFWSGSGPCGCKILEFGPIIVIWFEKKCKCSKCEEHICECPEYDQ